MMIRTLRAGFQRYRLPEPELWLEPGRSLVSFCRETRILRERGVIFSKNGGWFETGTLPIEQIGDEFWACSERRAMLSNQLRRRHYRKGGSSQAARRLLA